MTPISISLHHTQVTKISELLKYEEPRVIRRCNILSCLRQGMTSGLISKALHVDSKTVRNIAHVYLESGLDAALYDDERSGRPIDIDDREKSRVVAMVCSDPPSGHYRWTLDLIVEEVEKRNLLENKESLSREGARIILQEHDLKPWQEKMWCIPEVNEKFTERMEDVLEVSERAYDLKRPVVCIDEKPVPLHSDVRERVVEKPGSRAKVDYEYKKGAG